MKKELITASKFLSFVLRHKPESIDLSLDPHGWVSIDVLIKQAARHDQALSRDLIYRIVEHNDKQRFALSDDYEKIRANQGHTINIDLQLDPSTPPDTLYHGTANRFITSIQQQGILPSGRHHVHLSEEINTAMNVGSRYGKPVILSIRSTQMAKDGHIFFQTANGVWLTEEVPPTYFDILDTHTK